AYEGKVSVLKISPGFYLIDFSSIALSEWVLGRSGHIHHSSLLLRIWHVKLNLLICPQERSRLGLCLRTFLHSC
ncbi:hypothetical protein LINPERPRIM_LOCUS25848, partial [Linum perenne]